MKLLSKELAIRFQCGRDVVPGFVTYISRHDPVIMHCYGWQDYSDAYDDYVITISRDNGRTWSEPYLHWKSEASEQGKLRYIEPAAFFDPDTEKLLTFTDLRMYPDDKLDVDAQADLVFQSYDPCSNAWGPRELIQIPGETVPIVSFAVPIKTSRGRIIVPGQTDLLDEDGNPVHYKGCWSPAGVIVNLLGDYQEDGSISWTASRPVIPDLERSSRGHYEPTLAELADGRLVMILRGDNSMFPEKHGYKWVSFSDDHGDTWSAPEPVPFTDGQMIESSSSGSLLLRCEKSGTLYWIGNLCLPGERANGNLPRSSLSILQVQEEPFAFMPETRWVIDEKNSNDSPDLLLSNFRCYQDRLTGELVLYVTRLAELGMEQWQIGDYYRYRIELE